jgi:hypothetical protein
MRRVIDKVADNVRQSDLGDPPSLRDARLWRVSIWRHGLPLPVRACIA